MLIVIETPKGSAQKFSYDPATRFFKLKKMLPAGMFFPYDFGFIPGTLGEDGDPLDVLLLNDHPTFTGCLVEARLIGALRVYQSKGNEKKIRNDRFICVSSESALYSQYHTINELPGKLAGELADFFVQYQERAGKKITVTGKMGAKQAVKLVKENQEMNEKNAQAFF
jgi:inorganic pyrophosphatase